MAKAIEKRSIDETLNIFEYILNNNTKSFIKENSVIIEKIRGCIKENGELLHMITSNIDGDPYLAFQLLVEYDPYHASHGVQVEEQSNKILDYLDYKVNRETLSYSARLHDYGKLGIKNEIKFKEKLLKKGLELWERLLIQYGHTLLGETFCILAKLDAPIIHAAACHHDNHEDYPYHHEDINKVLETMAEIDPKTYSRDYNKKDMKINTEIVSISNDIVSVSDTVCSMKDPNRKYYDPKKYDNKQIYSVLIKRVLLNKYSKDVVDAFLKSENLDDNKIRELYKKVKENEQ